MPGAHVGVGRPCVHTLQNAQKSRSNSVSSKTGKRHALHARGLFPAEAIKFCLHAGGVGTHQVDAIAQGFDCPRHADGSIAAHYAQVEKTNPVDERTRRWHRENLEYFHPERQERIAVLHERFPDFAEPRPATVEEVLRCHDLAYVETVRAVAEQARTVHLDPDTICTPTSYDAGSAVTPSRSAYAPSAVSSRTTRAHLRGGRAATGCLRS